MKLLFLDAAAGQAANLVQSKLADMMDPCREGRKV
jgi:hypothetical protein